MTLHRLKVPARLRKTLRSINPDREYVLVGPSERAEYHPHTSKRNAPAVAGDGVAVLRETVRRVKGVAGIAQVIVTIEAEPAEPQSVPTKKAA